MTSLFAAVENCDQWRANFLLDRGIRVNMKDSNGENVLVTALYIEHDKKRHNMFRWLLSKGADIMTISKTSGRDILLWATYLNRTAEVNLILSDIGGELDLKRKDLMGFTALHYCTFYDCYAMLKNICLYMRRFDISVDIPDAEGMTPYLLARRLGHNECAHILKDIGMACPYMGDKKTGQSQHFWDTLGDWERSMKREKEKAMEVGMYKRMGRLPQLIKARYDTDRIKLVPSMTEQKAFTTKHTRHNTLEPLDLSGFDPTESVIKSKVDVGSTKKQNMTSILTNIYKCIETDSFFVHQQNELRSKSHDDWNYSPRMMHSIMDIASEQGTHTFVPPAKPPRRGTNMYGAAQAAAFGLRMKRRMNRSRMSKASSDRIGSNTSSYNGKDNRSVLIQ